MSAPQTEKRLKNPDIWQSRMSETNPFFSSLSHLGFSHLNFPGAKSETFWPDHSDCPMTERVRLQNERSPWIALKINIPMKAQADYY